MNPDFFVSRINEILPEPQASLLAGMLFGIRSTMPAQFYEALLRTGTVHLITLSGTNVSLLVRLLFDGLGSYFGKYARVGITLAGIIGFAFLVGGGPTIVRASIMGILTIIAPLVGRKSVPLVSLCIASTCMAIVDMNVLSNISFQLSFFATLGIILFDPNSGTLADAKKGNVLPQKRLFIHNISSFVRSDVRLTLSAQVFTIPIILWYFNRISLISPIANVAVGWLVGPIMYLGILVVIAASVYRPLGYALGLILWAPLTIFIHVVNLLSKVPFASLDSV